MKRRQSSTREHMTATSRSLALSTEKPLRVSVIFKQQGVKQVCLGQSRKSAHNDKAALLERCSSSFAAYGALSRFSLTTYGVLRTLYLAALPLLCRYYFFAYLFS